MELYTEPVIVQPSYDELYGGVDSGGKTFFQPQIIAGNLLNPDVTGGNFETPNINEWQNTTGNVNPMEPGLGYIENGSSQLTFTLPTAAVVGERFSIAGHGAGGWKLAQNAGQQIHFGRLSTTVGTGGYLESSAQYDVIQIICTVANTTFMVNYSIGNITVV